MSQNELSTRGATWMRALAVGPPVPGYGSTPQVVDATPWTLEIRNCVFKSMTVLFVLYLNPRLVL